MVEVSCRKCGKNFIPTYEWAYRDGKGTYCSWHCYNHRKDVEKRRKYKYVEIYDKRGALLRRFKSANDASEYTGFDIKHIQTACRNGAEFHGFVWKYKD
jgi:hypothetical protein